MSTKIISVKEVTPELLKDAFIKKGCGLGFDEKPFNSIAGGKRGKICCEKWLCPKCSESKEKESLK